MKTSIKISLLVCLLSSHAAQAYDCQGLPEWSSSIAYTGGKQVQHKSKAYKANWWSQNNDPTRFSGQWQEWSLLGSCDGMDGNVPPVANANGPYSGTVNKLIAFSSSGSSDADGNIASYAWDFGDGSSSTQANPSYRYASSGSFTVTLTVTDSDGASSASVTIANIARSDDVGNCDASQYQAGTRYNAGDMVSNIGRKYRCEIAGWCSSSAAWAYEAGVGSAWQQAWTEVGLCGADGNQPPVASANGPYSGAINQSISFSSTGSSDPDGTIVSYRWDFGDGGFSTQSNPTYVYAAAGTYQASLTVTDNQGASSSAFATANIETEGTNLPPTANANGAYSAMLGAAILFSSAGTSDPDGSIASYQWDFGDGNTSTLANPSYTYAASGTYDVTLTVADNEGSQASVSTIATVTANGEDHDKKVVGYFTEWGIYGRDYHVKDIHTSGSAAKLTHIIYAFGNVQNGECKLGDSYADYDKAYSAADSVDGVADTWKTGALRGNFGQLRRLKKMYPGLKVVWSFGGWTWSGGFGQAAANPSHFADSCYNLVFDPRWADVFDGIDIDWEYPNECGLGCDTSGFNGYRDLMHALRSRFGNKLVTSAIGAGETKLNAANYGGAAQYVDFYMIMTYDFFGTWDAAGPTAPHSPLYNYSGIPTEGFYSDNGIQVLRSNGVPSDKILLGIGFYGRGWTGVNQTMPGGSASGAALGTYERGIEDYKVLKDSCPTNGTIAGTAYAHCGTNWWSYDTPTTIIGKMNYVKQQGLAGAFFWELSGDTSDGELVDAIDEGLK